MLASGGVGHLGAISLATLLQISVFAAFFSTLPSFLFIYVIREIGPGKANLVNFGQIIIGVVCGVFVLAEWQNLKTSDELVCWIGVVQIFLALTFDFSAAWQANKTKEEAKKGDQAELLANEA
jgi:glucose uptake protein GlcU